MERFERVDWDGAEFDRVSMRGARLNQVDLSGARLRGAVLSGAVLRGVEMVDVAVDGFIRNLTVEGVDVMPYVLAELDRRQPERVAMRPTDPAGFRTAWDIVERRWAETVERARRLPPERLHESVDEEWSFIETLRHLLCATDSWVRRAVLGDPAPWDPLDLPFDEMPPELAEVLPRDRAARPSLDTVLALRRDRMATVRGVVDGLTDESLAAETEPLDSPGWPQAGSSFPVRRCLLTVLDEEWSHRQFAERDLAVLETTDH
jgi:DinB superfamily/Pentapeptide repeats (8 copies)